MYLVSDNTDTRAGLRLVGVDGVVAHTREEIRRALEGALADRTVGIILVTEKIAKQFPEVLDDIKLNRRLPLVVEIPDRHGTGRGKDFLTEYVREAIGVKL